MKFEFSFFSKIIVIVKIGKKIAIHLSANVNAYALRARFIFSTGKNMAAPSKLILGMVTYHHAGSHVKPYIDNVDILTSDIRPISAIGYTPEER